jgi:hypothetical protein
MQYHHVPFYLHPPNHHHLPDALHLSKKPQVAPFPQDHDSPWDSLGSSGAPVAHLAPPPQSEDKSQKLESRKDNDDKALSKGSPLCPVKTKVKNRNQEKTTTTRHCLRGHLFALAMASLKVGCQVKSSLRCLHQSHRFHLHAPLAGIKGDSTSGQVHFDSDSFPIRIDNHASYCMANSPHLFYDLILSKINGIHEGLAILGKGTFRFSISNDDGRVHPIHIPNSPYLPKLQGVQFALNGKIPKKLALIKLPKCTRCLFGAMTNIPWRGKESISSHKVFATTKPGETVSVDQMVSTKVGFFAKHAFEKFTTEHDVPFHHYRCDNGLYSNDAFKESCKSSHQRLTFCGVNAHFQNGIAISESKQKQLLHAHALWTAAVHFAPWPYATWNAILLNFARPAISTATNGDYSLQLIVESFFTGANQVAPAMTICDDSFKMIVTLASEGAALCS